MEDIFYLSTKKINVKDINKIAEKVNVKSTFIPKTLDVLEIEYCDGITASWFNMSLCEFQEPEDEKFLNDNKIEAVFCISHHPRNLKIIMPHIKNVLKEYGGWIGNDNEKFQPWFNLENIESFEYQI
ncbi:hypothetical protein SAMN02745163_01963 [Clostridium cavendishii DSM 21758]|uniref:Uncharacterized protein n=1 Tax=Clostridium cavendishii DSM 21758 TaxID=1121302 RepID=A0A1M6JA55_9CLOT|nr:hypothetical protein [Clostridium cavendishii]SHJ43586.1 hypothetical protein SAMN02745163_01963 [Clostridium cavendishii DSM 21758]